jgi:hypothetical protein
MGTGFPILDWLTLMGAVLGVICLALALARLLMPMGRLDPVCRKCGYAMEGLAAEHENCPECGKKLEKPDREYWGTWMAGPIPCAPRMLAILGWGLLALAMVRLGPVYEIYTYGVEYTTAFEPRDNPRYSPIITMTTVQTRWETQILAIGGTHRKAWILKRSVVAKPTLAKVDYLSAYNFSSMGGGYMNLKEVLDAPARTTVGWPLEKVAMAAETRKAMKAPGQYYTLGASDDEIERTIADMTELYEGRGLAVGKVTGVDRDRTDRIGMIQYKTPRWLPVGTIGGAFLMGWGMIIMERKMVKKRQAAFNAGTGAAG